LAKESLRELSAAGTYSEVWFVKKMPSVAGYPDI